MYIKTTYQNVKDNYPDALKELESQLRSGRSKYKDAPIEDFEYTFAVAERIEGMSGMDFVDMLRNGGPEPEEETVDEVVERRLKNSFVSINMKTPTATYNQTIDTLPPEVEQSYREDEEESRAEQERIDNLTPEERNKEIQGLIKELTGMGGFFGIKVEK